MITNIAQFESDVTAVEPEAAVNGPCVFSFEGKEYIGQRTPIRNNIAMADAGFELKLDFALLVRLSQFVAPCTAPTEQDIIKMDDVEYRIADATEDQLGIVVTYALKQST